MTGISAAVSWTAMQLTINGTPRTFDRPVVTVADVVRALALEGKRIAVERNGEIVPRSRYADTEVDSADRLEIVGAVGGG
jgi:sulfur carrier protein